MFVQMKHIVTGFPQLNVLIWNLYNCQILPLTTYILISITNNIFSIFSHRDPVYDGHYISIKCGMLLIDSPLLTSSTRTFQPVSQRASHNVVSTTALSGTDEATFVLHKWSISNATLSTSLWYCLSKTLILFITIYAYVHSKAKVVTAYVTR